MSRFQSVRFKTHPLIPSGEGDSVPNKWIFIKHVIELFFFVASFEPTPDRASGHKHPGAFVEVIDENFTHKLQGTDFNSRFDFTGDEISDGDGRGSSNNAPGKSFQDAARMRFGSVFSQKEMI